MRKGQIFVLMIVAMFQLGTTHTAIAQCISGNCQNGTGVFRYSGGAKYSGQFYSGKPHGTGKMEFTNGNLYQGEWQNGIREGRGKMTFKNGNRYEGEFKRGKIAGNGIMFYQNMDKYEGNWANESPNGIGKYYFKTKERYEGEFKDGHFHGQGTMFYPDGAKFVGGWKSNRKDGIGKLIKPNGQVIDGTWANGEMVNKISPSGSMSTQETTKPETNKIDIQGLRNCGSTHCKSGRGYFDYPDGSRWIGEFKDGYPEGKGICYYINGDRYEGSWARNAPNGDGVMYFASGRVYGATWLSGSPVKELDAAEDMPGTNDPINVDASKKVKIWAVIVGVGRYAHMPTLKFTDDDAFHMYAFFKSPEGGALPEEQITILIDEAATRENILRAMRQQFLKADANDVVMLYFSGHGLEGCFLPVDFDGYNNKLRHDEVKRIFQESKAKHKLCIADACHSGTLQHGLAARSPVSVTLDKFYGAFEATGGGTALLMSSKGEELSLEDHGLRQGVFSHYLLKGMKGAADSNKDQIVTIEELFRFVHLKVREYTANAQTPVLSGDFDKNMPVSIKR